MYANSLLKEKSKSKLILTILQCSVAARTTVQRLMLSLPGGNSFDFQHFASVCLQEKKAASTVLSHTYIPGNLSISFGYPQWSQLLSTDTRGCQLSALNRPAICLAHINNKKSMADDKGVGYTVNRNFRWISWVVRACPLVTVCFGPNKNHPAAGGSFVTFLFVPVVVRCDCCQSRCCAQTWTLVSKSVRNNSTVSGDRPV